MAGPGSLIAALHDLQVSTVNPADLPTGPTRAAHYLAAPAPDIVLFGPGVPPEAALAIAGELDSSSPEIEVVLVAQPSQQLLADALRNGVRDVVAPDAGNELIGSTVNRVAAAVGLRRTRLAGPSGDSPSEDGDIITVMAAKGGVGKTTVATNLAVELAREAPNEVVLVDLDLVAGDVDVVLGLKPTASVATVATPGAILDPTVIKLSLSSHRSGLLVLAAPDDLVEADTVDCELVLEMFDLLRRSFRHIVVDTAPGAGAPLAAAVEAADDLLAIASPEVAGLRSLRRNLEGLSMLGLDRARRHLVVNRSENRAGLDNQTIENTVELRVSHTVPDSKEIAAAANQGVPFVDAYPRNDAVRAFKELAADFGARQVSNAQPSGRATTTLVKGRAA
ncbi:MAG: P-loop NTPase [Acidimicrobiia bacterium]|nr:P-loop NTPase [Acidimicrobiia bacterium]